MIRFDKVTKKFRSGTIALEDVSFVVEPGEMIALVGPSGAGKTTVLRLLLREFLPSEGTITVNEFTVNTLKNKDLPKLRRIIGAIFQDFKLLEDQTVSENISLVLELAGRTDQEISERILQVLNQVGLAGKELLFPKQLSGGEVQRVAIARALALHPTILFADEPTGNLDRETASGIATLLKDIHEKGSTIVIATHDEAVLDILRPRILELCQGRLSEKGKKK